MKAGTEPQGYVHAIIPLLITCRSGEIGRRSGFKIRRAKPRAGSSPAFGTTPTPANVRGRLFFRLSPRRNGPTCSANVRRSVPQSGGTWGHKRGHGGRNWGHRGHGHCPRRVHPHQNGQLTYPLSRSTSGGFSGSSSPLREVARKDPGIKHCNPPGGSFCFVAKHGGPIGPGGLSPGLASPPSPRILRAQKNGGQSGPAFMTARLLTPPGGHLFMTPLARRQL